jgi:hypothetical protein
MRHPCICDHWTRVIASILITSILVAENSVAIAGPLETHPAPAGVPGSTAYKVKVDDKEVFVYDARIDEPRNNAFSSFDMTGPVKVQVTGPEGFQSATIRPASAGIRPEVNDRTISFALTKPCQLSIELNGGTHYPLFLFANPPEVNPPSPQDAGVRYFGPGNWGHYTNQFRRSVPEAGLLVSALTPKSIGNPNPEGQPLSSNPRMINEYGWLWVTRDGKPTTLTQQSRSGRAEKNGATLILDTGRLAYLVTEPTGGAFAGFSPLSDPTRFSLTTPDGINVATDRQVGLCRVVVQPKLNAVAIDYSWKPGQQPTGDRVQAFLISGCQQMPQVKLNGQPVKVTLRQGVYVVKAQP